MIIDEETFASVIRDEQANIYCSKDFIDIACLITEAIMRKEKHN